MIKFRIAAAIALALAGTTGITSAIAADTAQAAAAPAPNAAKQDFQKLSEQGSQAFQDLGIARLAIFNGHPNAALQLIKRAQTSLIKAEGDGTAFDKAEASLTAPPQHPNPVPADNGSTVRWLPVGADLAIDQSYKSDPAKVSAVATANEHLKKGERTKAIETLRLADVNMSYTLFIVPLKSFVADLDQAAGLLSDGKYYEANISLKRVQDSVRFDWVDLNATPAAAGTRNGLKEPVTSSVQDNTPDASANK
jgi:hypothetical protein